MGRSLGSAPALELTGHHPEAIAGLILESGFAHTGPLLRRLALYEASPALDKRLVTIPGADHNTIFAVGWRPDLAAVEALAVRRHHKLPP